MRDFLKRDLTRGCCGCSISGSEGIGVNVAGSRSQCSSSVQHLGYGARMMASHSTKSPRSMVLQESGPVEFGRRQATLQRVVMLAGTNQQLTTRGLRLR